MKGSRPRCGSSPTTCRGLVIPGSGHWVADEAPEELLAALAAFLAPDQDGH